LHFINHPVLQLLDRSPASFVGEEIEISFLPITATTLSINTEDASAADEKLGLLSSLAKEVKVTNIYLRREDGETHESTYEHGGADAKAMEDFVP
jgi:hypothetical protein